MTKIYPGKFYSVEEWDGTVSTVQFLGISGVVAPNHVATKSDMVLVRYLDGTVFKVAIRYFIKQIRAYHGSCLVLSAY